MEALTPTFGDWRIGRADDAPSKHPDIQASKHPDEPLRLLEIERELAGPDAKAHLARYDAILSGLATRLDAAMNNGLPPDEFPRVEALREANTIARKILRLAVRVDGQPR